MNKNIWKDTTDKIAWNFSKSTFSELRNQVNFFLLQFLDRSYFTMRSKDTKTHCGLVQDFCHALQYSQRTLAWVEVYRTPPPKYHLNYEILKVVFWPKILFNNKLSYSTQTFRKLSWDVDHFMRFLAESDKFHWIKFEGMICKFSEASIST